MQGTFGDYFTIVELNNWNIIGDSLSTYWLNLHATCNSASAIRKLFEAFSKSSVDCMTSAARSGMSTFVRNTD